MRNSYTTKVCIIGAGVSGLKAAQTLLSRPEFSNSDVVILEAQDRIGGRIRTVSTRSKLGLRYDFGAAWFHDSLTNEVLHESIADGTFDIQKDGYFDDKDVTLFASDNDGAIDYNDLKLTRVAEDIERYIELTYSASLDVADMSLDEIVAKYVEKYGIFLTEEQKNYSVRMLRYMELWFGIPLSNISAKYAVMNHQGRNLYNKKGFSFVVEKLRSQIKCEVLLGEKVTTINRDFTGGSRNHRVITASGTTVDADYLVVTVPHSVLKLPEDHEYGITWQPRLPRALSEALQNIHFGALGKVILEFDNIWWDNTQDRMEVLADIGIVLEIPVPFQYPICVINYGRVHGASSLVVLIQSPVTEYLEANPHKAWEYMKPMLEKIKVRTISDPINVLVTDWTQNPYARGSYTSVSVGDDPIDLIIQLSGEHDFCGLGPESTVRFAGEHTIADGAGCVHGAYNSGIRAAEWIFENLAKSEGSRL